MNFCPLHPDQKMFEKTGEFGPYYSHIITDVGFCNGKRIKPFTPKPDYQASDNMNTFEKPKVATAPETREPIKARDYDAEARGKVRYGFAIEAYKLGKPLTEETKQEINLWTDFVMSNK